MCETTMNREADQVIQISSDESAFTILDIAYLHDGGSSSSPRKNQIVPNVPPYFSDYLGDRSTSGKVTNNVINTNFIPPDAWLPITASREGNTYSSAFHLLCSGIGFQALMLPAAFTVLGWTWGSVWLSFAFVWQCYTIWLMVQLHESLQGKRYDRFLLLCKAAFGQKLGVLLGLFPTLYLSGAACVMLLMTAGDAIRLLMRISSSSLENESLPLTTIECYLVFAVVAISLALLLPNLDSVAWISFIGATAAVGYCTLIWVISISKSRPDGISYDRVMPKSDIGSILSVFNALGIIALAFRGHNLILEIQATVPSNEEKPSRVPMWRGVKFAYSVIALCLYPLAIAGYWAYGDKIVNRGGILKALHAFHRQDTSNFLLILTTVLVLIHCLSSYQIYAMPTFDNLTFAYTSRKEKPCPKWVRFAFRVIFGLLTFFIAVAIPFLRGLAGILGGISLPLTFAYPCFMWIAIRKPQRWSIMWCTNMVFGALGTVLGVLVTAGGIWTLINPGIDVRFFRP